MLERENNPNFTPGNINIDDIINFVEHPEKRLPRPVVIGADSALSLAKYLRSAYAHQKDAIRAQIEIGGGVATNEEGSYLDTLTRTFVGAYASRNNEKHVSLEITQNDVEYISRDLSRSIVGMKLIMSKSIEKPMIDGYLGKTIPVTIGAIDGVRELHAEFSSVSQQEVDQNLLAQLDDQRRDLAGYYDWLRGE